MRILWKVVLAIAMVVVVAGFFVILAIGEPISFICTCIALLFMLGLRRVPAERPADRGGSALGSLIGAAFGTVVALTIVVAGLVRMGTEDPHRDWKIFPDVTDLGNVVLGGIEVAYGVAMLVIVAAWFVRRPDAVATLSPTPAAEPPALPTAIARAVSGR